MLTLLSLLAIAGGVAYAWYAYKPYAAPQPSVLKVIFAESPSDDRVVVDHQDKPKPPSVPWKPPESTFDDAGKFDKSEDINLSTHYAITYWNTCREIEQMNIAQLRQYARFTSRELLYSLQEANKMALKNLGISDEGA